MDACVALDAPHADERLSRPALQAIHHNALKRLPCARRFKIPELPTSERALCLVRLGTLPLDGLLHRLVNLGTILRQECLSAIKVQRLVKIAIKDRVGREDLAVATIANRINIALRTRVYGNGLIAFVGVARLSLIRTPRSSLPPIHETSMFE